MSTFAFVADSARVARAVPLDASLHRGRVSTRAKRPFAPVRSRRLATGARCVATPPRPPESRDAADVASDVLGPLEAPSLACGRRHAAVPYFEGPEPRDVLVNDAARDAVLAARSRDFIALPTADDPALVKLREVLEAGWRAHEPYGSGHAGLWPELFEAGARLVRSQFPQFGDDDAVEVLPGTGWLDPELADDAIDWVVRRPEGHVVSSKIHFATRLHRDPDSWTNPRTPQRPKDGWTDLAMPDRERFVYRFVNVWVARSAIDPTGQVWQSPLVVCLPRDGGAREWPFERRKLAMDAEEAEKEYNVRGIDPLNPKTWIPGANRLFRPLWNGGSADSAGGGGKGGGDGFGGGEAPLTEEERATFEFPELTPDDRHVFVTGPAMVFDSFDLWHGAATWDDEEAAKKRLSTVDTKGRQPFHRARCSVEMRFRVKIDVAKAEASGDAWGPFSAAVASGKFRDDGLRDSEARYDLAAGRVAK
jgi:hypothetical protein